MTILDYYEGIAEAKRASANYSLQDCRDVTPDSLRYRYGTYVLASRKKKGADKGYKEVYRWEWRDYRGYMNALRELFPTEYALQLCREEHADLMTDMWWNVPSYRDVHIREYRDRIKAIRMEFGLSKSAVAEFMRV